MPQLVRGGKHAFGWSRVREEGAITVPPEALQEYRLREGEEMVMLPGSRTSGGFGLARSGALERSVLGAAPARGRAAGRRKAPRGRVEGRPCPRVRLAGGTVTIAPQELERYGVGIGDRLLVIRGSGLAVGFAVRGPIVEEAGRHPELEVF